jgi:hypothetical protein
MSYNPLKKTNFYSIWWSQTFLLNAIRCFISGIFMAIFMYVADAEVPSGSPGWWIMIIYWPIGYMLS